MTGGEDPARDGEVDRVDRGREDLDDLTGRLRRIPRLGHVSDPAHERRSHYIPIAWYPASTYSVVPETFAPRPRGGTRGRATIVRLDLSVKRRALLEHGLHRR
jgi:hypothetical protein